MMTGTDIKRQFEEISAKVKKSSLPESASPLIDVLLSLFNVSLESNFSQQQAMANQINDLRRSIDNQIQTIDNQTQTIAEQTLTIQTLIQKLDKARQEKTEYEELVKSLKTMLRSKDVDLDALKRLLFQRGREQKRESSAKKPGKKAESAEPDPDGEKKKRSRLSHREKTRNCDAEADEFLSFDGRVIAASTREEAAKELPEFIESGGQTYKFVRWKTDGVKIRQLTTCVKVKTHVPVYVPAGGAPAITGINPEKDFLPKTLIGFGLMAVLAEERFQKRIPMNRIAKALSLGMFPISRQQLARYFIDAAEWLRPAYEYLKEKVLSGRVIHLDETFVRCQEEEKNRQYMLVFASENGCFYHYTDSRSQTVPFGLLQEHFGGGRWTGGGGGEVVISTDGWYDAEWLKDHEGGSMATLVGCMVHLRRYFWDVCAAQENHIDRDSEDYHLSRKILNLLQDIFHLDNGCETPEERTKMRKSGEIRKKFEDIERFVGAAYKNIEAFPDPLVFYTAKYVKAITYARNQWKKFARIMEDGSIPLTNSEAERCIRDWAVLRNSTGSGFASIEGAKSAAIFSSFHETCKKFGVRLSEYLECLFRHIGMFKDMLDDKKISSEEKNSILEACMPWNFSKA